MLLQPYQGQTVRLTIKGLAHASLGPVLSGAVVAIALTDPFGVPVTGSAVTNSGDDWSADFTPLVPGVHEVRATATYAGAVFEAKGEVLVRAF